MALMHQAMGSMKAVDYAKNNKMMNEFTKSLSRKVTVKLDRMQLKEISKNIE